MKILETEHEKKSFAITVSIFILLFLFLLLVKLTIVTVPEVLEGGGGSGEIAINFGNSDFGSGINYKSKNTVAAVTKSVPQTIIDQVEKMLTQETTDAPVISEVKVPNKTDAPKAFVKETAKPSKSATDALASLLNSTTTGDGNDNVGGNKGKLNGDINTKGYSGDGGSGTGTGIGNGSGYRSGSGSGTGGGSGWKLSGRKLSTSGKVVQKCNEYGTVVVQITVNRNGEVVNAKYTKGTTNTDTCLVQPALETAKKYKWQPDSDAPETQIGYITVNFKSSE